MQKAAPGVYPNDALVSEHAIPDFWRARALGVFPVHEAVA